jgi:hypothetical protein
VSGSCHMVHRNQPLAAMTRGSPLARSWHWNQFRLSDLLALLREEYWGSGLIQINDNSSCVRYR